MNSITTAHGLVVDLPHFIPLLVYSNDKKPAAYYLS